VPADAPRSPIGRLPVRKKLSRLLKLARGRKRGLVLTHDNPDPDSIASAVALALVLERKAGVTMHVAYGGIIGRAENIAFVRVLKLPVEPVSKIVFDDYELLALVDTQQNVGNHALPIHLTADVVIDHHPMREEDQVPVPFSDIGNTGATSTLLTQYLRAARLEPGAELATALYYGIKADTRDLERQTRNPDVDSYLWLFPKIDRELLSKIEHPDVPARYFQLYHAAIERAKVYSSAVITDMGEVYSPDMVAEVAERLSFLDTAVWSLAYGSYRSQLYLSLRVSDRRMKAGKLIRDLTQDLGGSAGGHGSMAGARLPLYGTRKQRLSLKREVVRRFKEALGIENERGTALLASGEPN
jgi:nanoRNase/pAp phosphatase (c-di-AMP/oligoRNAs hydrolase)